MSIRQTLGLLMVFTILITSSAICGETVETRDLHVQAKSLNLYGHWSAEHVEITLVKPNSPAEKWRVIANDWQVYPQLSAKAQRSKNKKEKAPEYLAIDQVLAMRNQMIAQSENGYDIEEIVDICIKELLKSELIRDVEHMGGDSYNVHFTKKNSKSVNIGFRRLPRELREEIDSMEEEKLARSFYAKFCDWLEGDGVILMASSRIARHGVYVDAVDRQRPEFLSALEAIEEASQNKSEITPDNWKNKSVINSFLARSMCQKMDPTRKERR